MPQLIRAVIFLGTSPEGAVERLQGGSLKACQCRDQAEAAATIRSWGLADDEVLVIGGCVSGSQSWTALSPGGPKAGDPSCVQMMQAIVQHNRRSILAQALPAPSSAAAVKIANPTAPKDHMLIQQNSSGRPQQQQQQRILTVGYVMKASREQQLANACLLHLLSIDGICFMPFDVTRLDEDQGHIDVLLHKGSDELVVGADGASVSWSPNIMRLQAWLTQRPNICVIDPFKHTAKVLDRQVLSALLSELQHLRLPAGVRARAPRWCRVDNFSARHLLDQLAVQGLQPPFIVKPLVACGVQHSHSMALVLQAQALQQLQGQLPLPAVVQEFVNHGGRQFKVYVLHDKVFMTPRPSIPDIHVQTEQQEQQQQVPQQLLLFNSLSSLPTQLPSHLAITSSSQLAAEPQQPNRLAVEAIAAFLRKRLCLTLFGFDVVVVPGQSELTQRSFGHTQQPALQSALQSTLQQQAQQQDSFGSQELIVIDVNYFPNYRGGSNVPAMFRDAIKQRCMQHCQQQP